MIFMKQQNLIITISRQYGSGGREIGRMLAEELGLAFYDKELIALAAQKSGISKELFENADEMPSNSFLYSLSMGTHGIGTAGVPQFADILTNDKLFVLQSKVIRELADQNPCVIVGRCADYILRDRPRCVNVFFFAQESVREERICAEEGLSAAQAKEKIRKIDKRRASYYNYYSDMPWGVATSYHLSLDTTRLTSRQAAGVVKAYLQGIYPPGIFSNTKATPHKPRLGL